MYPRWSHKCSYVCLFLDVLYCFSMRCLVSSLVTQVFICVFVLRCVVLFQYEVSCILAGHTSFHMCLFLDVLYCFSMRCLVSSLVTQVFICVFVLRCVVLFQYEVSCILAGHTSVHTYVCA